VNGEEAKRLGDLLEGIALTSDREVGDLRIAGLTCDSRTVREGQLFFCRVGQETDGHFFASAATTAGARAIVAERELSLPEDVPVLQVASTQRAMARAADRFYGSPSRDLIVVGVTGTNGKTTVAYIVRSMLEAAGHATGILGTVEYCWGDVHRRPLTTTPEVIDLQAMLREMITAGCRAAVLEVSSHGLTLGRVDETDFDVVVFTNLSHDHLDFHGSFAGYRDAKAALFAREEPYGTDRVAVLNLDDATGRAFAQSTALPVVSYSTSRPAEVQAELVRTGLRGTDLQIHMGRKTHLVRTPLPGRFNLQNAAAAAATGVALGLGAAEIVAGLEALPSVPGRFETVRLGQSPTVIIDYAHSPDALERLLGAVREMTAGPITVVFGCGGDRDRDKRPLMGRIACEGADRAIITNDNPRREDPAAIASEILAGCSQAAQRPEIVLDRAEAIERALRACPPDGVVVVAGKGHEDYQIVGAERRDFDDCQVVRNALQTLGFDPQAETQPLHRGRGSSRHWQRSWGWWP